MKKTQNLPPLVNNNDSSYQDYFSNSSDDQEQIEGPNYVKKNPTVTFDTRRRNKKNKTKRKLLDNRIVSDIFIDTATDLEDSNDGGDFRENDNVRLLKTKSNKKKDAPRSSKSNEEKALNEMKTISIMKGKNNKQKLADILSVLKVANMDKKKARKVIPTKEEELLTFHEIPTDDITLTTDDETTSGEKDVKSESQMPKTNQLEKENQKKEKPKHQSSVDTIHLDELFSPKKNIDKTGSVSQGEKTDNEITLDKLQGDVKSIKQETTDDEAIEIPETSREPEIKFAKINIGGGGGPAPKKVENSVQHKSEKKQKRADSNVSLKSEVKRLSSAGSSSSSSSGAELYV